jgi:hypothetical protein
MEEVEEETVREVIKLEGRKDKTKRLNPVSK